MSTESQGIGSIPLHDRVEISRLGVWSIAKIAAAVYAVIALIPGIFITLGFLVGAAASTDFTSNGGPIFGLFFGVGAIIVLPIVYGLLGFIFGAISAAIYNLMASKVGGVIIETKQR